jgi:hypothetical protein
LSYAPERDESTVPDFDLESSTLLSWDCCRQVEGHTHLLCIWLNKREKWAQGSL